MCSCTRGLAPPRAPALPRITHGPVGPLLPRSPGSSRCSLRRPQPKGAAACGATRVTLQWRATEGAELPFCGQASPPASPRPGGRGVPGGTQDHACPPAPASAGPPAAPLPCLSLTFRARRAASWTAGGGRVSRSARTRTLPTAGRAQTTRRDPEPLARSLARSHARTRGSRAPASGAPRDPLPAALTLSNLAVA